VARKWGDRFQIEIANRAAGSRIGQHLKLVQEGAVIPLHTGPAHLKNPSKVAYGFIFRQAVQCQICHVGSAGV